MRAAKPNLKIASDESEKKLRGVYGIWKALELLKEKYPKAAIMLMDPSAPFDILVLDPSEGNLVAVEVKAPRASSAAARHLTDSQEEMKRTIESRASWKFLHQRCIIY